MAAMITLSVIVTGVSSAAATSYSGGCVNAIQALGPLNNSSNISPTLCPGVSADFTTSQWNSGWTHLYINNQPCNGKTNANAESYDYNGGLYGYASTYASSSYGCSSNTAEVQINVGLHGQSFSAWKSGYAYYTVVANFTFKDFEALATYCQAGGTTSAKANISSLVAVYDDNLGTGVGASTNGDYDSATIWQSCNVASSWQDHGASFQAIFTTSTTINHGDTLVPRGSVTADAWVSNPSTYPYASHANSTLDFNNDGYGYITLNSIWVY